MPELTARRGMRDDRGAVATVFAVLLAGGVLLGSLALVVDVGQVYVEREELQTGADAAVLAVARACAVSATECATNVSLRQLAQRYADDNAADGRAQVLGVCGRLADRVEECPAANGNRADCLGPPAGSAPAGAGPAGAAPFIEVRLGTQLPGDRFVLPPVFAQAMAGNAGYQGTSVAACARATWTARAQVSIVALAMSDCDFAAATAGGYADASAPVPSDERVILIGSGAVPRRNCPAADPPAPWLRAGPPVWLGGDSSCQLRLPASGEVTTPVDQVLPSACLDRLRQARDRKEIGYLPVYDMVSSGAPDRTYHVVGLAPFVVTGFQLGPTALDRADSSLSVGPDQPCGDPALRCIVGVFVGAVIPMSATAHGSTGGGADGTAIVTLIG